MKYRMLGQDEKPDKKMGDEFQCYISNLWWKTNASGKRAISDMENKRKYRRPVDENGRDLK